jgi:DNA-binding winged helix-turn-helix (wHTH) protein
MLLHGGWEVALIPRYFDLLLLVERRGEAVSRREIFDAVWSDMVVQAVESPVAPVPPLAFPGYRNSIHSDI